MPSEEPYAVAEVLAHLAELRSAVRACDDEPLLLEADAVLMAILATITSRDRTWLAALERSARRFADRKLADALRELGREQEERTKRWADRGRRVKPRASLVSDPVSSQEAEGRHLVGVARQVLLMASWREDTEPRWAAELIEGALHAALARCTTTWRHVPRSSGRATHRVIKASVRAEARARIARLLTDDVRRDAWSSGRTAERLVRVYLGALGISAKAVGNVIR